MHCVHVDVFRAVCYIIRTTYIGGRILWHHPRRSKLTSNTTKVGIVSQYGPQKRTARKSAMMRSAQGRASKTISCRPAKSGGNAMQASNAPPDHQPGIACPIWNPAGKVERKSNRFESRMNSSASGIPGGAFLCTFVLFCSFQNLIYGATSI